MKCCSRQELDNKPVTLSLRLDRESEGVVYSYRAGDRPEQDMAEGVDRIDECLSISHVLRLL